MNKKETTINKNNKKKVQLTIRDRNLLHFLFSYKVASEDQICRFIFNMVHRKVAQRRLKKLIEFKIIQKCVYANNDIIFYGLNLTKSGLSYLDHQFEIPLKRMELKSGQMKHDLELLEIAERLKQSAQVVKYYPENILQSYNYFSDNLPHKAFSHLRTDGMLMIKGMNNILNVAIEYESMPKAASRWAEKIQNFYTEMDIHGVFYICADKYILNAIRKIEKEMNHKFTPKVYVILLDELKSKSGYVTFINLDGHSFRINFQ